MGETATAEARVWLVDDGELHHVVARDWDEAERVVAESMGDTLEEYRREHQPLARPLPANAFLTVILDDCAIAEETRKAYPKGTKFTARVRCGDAAQHMSGMICSTCW